MTRKGKKRASRQQEQHEPSGSQILPHQSSDVQGKPSISHQQQPAGPQQQHAAVLQQQQQWLPASQRRPTAWQQQQQPAVVQQQQQQSFAPQQQQTQWRQRPGLQSQPDVQGQQPQYFVPPQQEQYAVLQQQQQYVVPQQRQQYTAPQQQEQYTAPQEQEQYTAPQQQEQYTAPQQQEQCAVQQQQQQPYVGPQQQRRSLAPHEQRRSLAPHEQRRSLAPHEQRRSLAPHEQRRSLAPQQQQRTFAPQGQHRPSIVTQHQQSTSQQQHQTITAEQQQQAAILQQQQHTFAPQDQHQPSTIAQQHEQSTSRQQHQQSTSQQQHRMSVSQQPRQQYQSSTSQQPRQQYQSSTSQQRSSTSKQQYRSNSQLQQQIVPKQLQETAVSTRRGNGKFKLPSDLRQMYIDKIPRNAGGGTQGITIQVLTNMFRIQFGKDFPDRIMHYDVVITPNTTKSLFHLVFEQYRKKHFPNRFPGFDRKKNAYSRDELPFGEESVEDEVTVFDPEREQERVYKIYLKKAAVLDMSWLKDPSGLADNEREENCVQALATIFHYGPACRFTPVGKSLYPKPDREIPLTDGYNLWTGVFQSVLVRKRVYLNVDVAHKGFPKEQSVIDLLKDLCKHPRDREPLSTIHPENIKTNIQKVTKSLKGLKIRYELPGQPTTRRIYPIHNLSDCPRENTFPLKDNTMCTVEDYYLNHKNYRIQFPELPCLWVGRPEKSIHLPMELCTIVGGQITHKNLTESQTTKMILYASVDAKKRAENIAAAFASLKLDEQPTLMKEFHLSVDGEFEKVPARILNAPTLKYSNKEVKVTRGEWRSQQFYIPCDLPDETWTIVKLDKNVKDRELYDLHDTLRREGKNVNMTIGKALTPFSPVTIQRGNLTDFIKCLEEKKKKQLKLVIVIIPNFDDTYSKVKQTAELKVSGGVLTQCIKAKTLSKLSPSTVTNILLKINSKLNGVNHILSPTCRPHCLSEPCMIVGADVTHPPPEDKNRPSIAAVVASHDLNPFQYNTHIRLQAPGTEQILYLREIMCEQLKYFEQKTNCVPEKIIFYRDGVGDTQLPEIMHFELNAIRDAVAEFTGSNKKLIPITFIVVQKRHHIRLFPTDRNCDRNFNVLPGTIVDTEITHPKHIDYYLVSHASIKGTARPTRYRCLCNESNLSEDDLQQLTYYLCHVYARCTRTVSYPAPTYYAHWAAYRARALLHDVRTNVENLTGERSKINIQMLDNPMHFV